MLARLTAILLALCAFLAPVAVTLRADARPASAPSCCEESCGCGADRCPCAMRRAPANSDRNAPVAPAPQRADRCDFTLHLPSLVATTLAALPTRTVLVTDAARADAHRPSGRLLLEAVSRWTT